MFRLGIQIMYCFSEKMEFSSVRPNDFVRKKLGFRQKNITLESGIDVGQGINIGPGKFGKKNLG